MGYCMDVWMINKISVYWGSQIINSSVLQQQSVNSVGMKNESTFGDPNYYNEFVDLKEVIPLKIRHKLKNNNYDNIKIATKKLPPDFFRPYTRQNPDVTQPLDRQTAIKTPCFGDDKKQSYSLSLIPKEKRNLDLDHQRISTLPVQEVDPSYNAYLRKNCTRELSRKDQQFSQRSSANRQLTRAEQHQSTQRQKIKYKKLTLNDEVYLEQKKMLNLQYENRIRLNIKKFFQEENEFIMPENINKSGRKAGALQLQKIAPSEPFTKVKVKKLPPLL